MENLFVCGFWVFFLVVWFFGFCFFFFTFIHWCCANTGNFHAQEQQQQKDPNTQITFSLGDSPVICSLEQIPQNQGFLEKQLYSQAPVNFIKLLWDLDKGTIHCLCTF